MHTSFWANRSIEDTFDLIASAEAMELFAGSALVPGIMAAREEGDFILVKDSWGFTNKERIVQARRPELLVFYINPNPLLKFFVRGLSEEWRLSSQRGGTLVERIFQFDQRLPFAKKQFLRAILQNNQDLAFFIRYAKVSTPLAGLAE